LALIISLWPRWTALALIGFTAVTLWLTYCHAGMGVVFRPRQNGEVLESLAIIGGLLLSSDTQVYEIRRQPLL
jgi:putative oxidoreductase